jgi:hypothetical protein
MLAAYHLILWGDRGPFVLSPLVTFLVLIGAGYGVLRAAVDLVRVMVDVVRLALGQDVPARGVPEGWRRRRGTS